MSDVLLLRVARALQPLRWKVVYVGGATTHLYLTDAAAPPATLTEDVDVVVEVRSRAEYVSELHDALRAAGGREDHREDAPACRWIVDGVQLDVLAPNQDLIGFTNRWYQDVLDNPITRRIGGQLDIHITTAPLFIATKLEAFDGRGNCDMLGSKDVEDILAVVDGRVELSAEVLAAPPQLAQYLRVQFTRWLASEQLEYAVYGYLRDQSDRAQTLLERLRTIASPTPV